MTDRWLTGAAFAALGVAILGCGTQEGRGAGVAEVVVSHAAVPKPVSGTEATAFLTLENHGGAPDTLLGVESPQAGGVMLHEMVGGRMEMVTTIPLPAGRRVRLVPGSYHLMMHELTGPLAVGDTVTLTLRYARADPVVVRAPVLRYTEAVEAATAPVR